MSSNRDSERIDLLLALAFVFDEGERRQTGDHERGGTAASAREARETTSRTARALESLSSLGAAERLAVGRRADWFARLTPGKQREWLGHILGRARAREAPVQLDEHVHPTHVVRALREEPPHIQRLILGHLPPGLAVEASKALGALARSNENAPVPHGARSDGGRDSRRRGATNATGRMRDVKDTVDEEVISEGKAAVDASDAGSPTQSPSPEIVSVVRRAFLSHFTSAQEIARPTPLDLLSGPELARLVRLLGVRETALACRGIAAKEAVASFLRRFPAEDARAIAAHITTLTDVEPPRIAFAEEVVREAMNAEPEPGAMLDRAGLRLLAFTLAGRNEARLSYTAQKLPLEAARWLRVLVEEAANLAPVNSESEEAQTREMMRLVARDTEALAVGLKRRTQLAGGETREVVGATGGGQGGARPARGAGE